MTLYRTPLVLMDHLSRSTLNLISETDDRFRELERRAATGDPEARQRLNVGRARTGQLSIGGSADNYEHVPDTGEPDNTEYRAGYKAGWSHAHRNPESPPTPSKGRGPVYMKGYEHGHQVGTHQRNLVQHFESAIHTGNRGHMAEATRIATDHLINPHRNAIGQAYRQGRRAHYSPSYNRGVSNAEAHQTVGQWLDDPAPRRMGHDDDVWTPRHTSGVYQHTKSLIDDNIEYPNDHPDYPEPEHPADFAHGVAGEMMRDESIRGDFH